MLQEGDYAENFELPTADGSKVTLDALLTTGDLILYFYPGDFTPGCTMEACQIRDMHDEILDSGTRIVGISPQRETSHQMFIKRYRLPFQLLCDPRKEVIRAFGVDGPLGFGVRRATFLINQERLVVRRIVSDFMIERHRSFIRGVISEGVGG